MLATNNSLNSGCSTNGLLGRGMPFLILLFLASYLALAITLFCLDLPLASRSNLGCLICYGYAFFTNCCILSHVALTAVVVQFLFASFFAFNSLALLLLAIASRILSSALFLLISSLFLTLAAFSSSIIAFLFEILLNFCTCSLVVKIYE